MTAVDVLGKKEEGERSVGESLACDTPGNWGSSTEEAHCVCNVCIVGSKIFRMFITMPPLNRPFCQRCGTSTPFEGISTKRRHLQNFRCASCGSAIHYGESKWLTTIAGQSHHCEHCGIQDRITSLPYGIARMTRSCEVCSTLLASYEQQRHVCHRCRRHRKATKALTKHPP